MKRHLGIMVLLFLLAGAVVLIGWKALNAAGAEDAAARGGDDNVVAAVEVAPVESGRIREIRVFSGTLQASARMDVAAKVGGRIEQLLVDLGDAVSRNQVVAELEDDEFVQAVAQADAELAVRKALRDQSASELELAERDFERANALQERGIASEAELDEISSRLKTSRAALAVAEAQVKQAEAALELAKIRLGYTQVRAQWSGEELQGLISERHQDAGNTVQPGDLIVSIVVLDPLTAVISVTERDYSRLDVGQPATVRTDAHPDRDFSATVARVAPVFRETSRQARLELAVPNADGALKPGMFVRVSIVLQDAEAEAIVPTAAIARRQGEDVIFLVDENGTRVRRVPVRVGIVEAGRAQVMGDDITGRVVTLGQELIDEGSQVRIASPTADGAVIAGSVGGRGGSE